MPRTRAAARKKAKNSTSDKSTNELTETTPKEQLIFAVRDLEQRIPRIIDVNVKKYEREALKSVRQIPDKSSTPLEIYKMSLSEFIARGGYMDKVMESLREEKMREFIEEADKVLNNENVPPVAPPIAPPIAPPKAPLPSETPMTRSKMRGTTSVAAVETVSRPKSKRVAARKKAELENEQFITPAVGTRSQTVLPPSTMKRLPKQLEEVQLTMTSKETGSPLNEKDAMESILVDMMGKCLQDVLPKLPKNARSKASKALEESLQETLRGCIRQDGEMVSIVTPSVSTRSRRLK